MPELPEVETVRRTLELRIVNEKIVDVKVLCLRICDFNEDNLMLLKGETIREIKRYGKYLFFMFDHYTLISHLRMEGKYYIKRVSDPIETHEHIIFTMESGMSLRYHDTRKFGTMKVVEGTNLEEILKNNKELSKLGPEANSSCVTPKYLYDKLHTKKEPLKTALLDQTILAGLGNIYVNEVLFKCRLHPLFKSNYVTLDDCKNILKNSKEILDEATLMGGTTIRSYTSSLGVTGRFQQNLLCHNMDGKLCPYCNKDKIIKIEVGGRGSYLCPSCQIKVRPYIVGITGGIGTGKSSVSNYLKECGYNVLDTDKISHLLTLKGGIEGDSEKVLSMIKNTFGEEYFDNDVLNRGKLGKLIFNDQKANNKLTDIIHPFVKKACFNFINEHENDGIVFLDVPLLFESGFNEICNDTICVFAQTEVNLNRLVKRDNISIDYALEKINSQMPITKKINLATFSIDNSYDLCYTYKQVDLVLNKLSKYKKEIADES